MPVCVGFTSARLHSVNWPPFEASGISPALQTKSEALPEHPCCRGLCNTGTAVNKVFIDRQKDLGSALLTADRSHSSTTPAAKKLSTSLVHLNKIPATPAPICVKQTSDQAFWRPRALITTMAHKGGYGGEKDASGHVSIDVAGKDVEIIGDSGVADAIVRKAIESGPFQRWLDHMRGPSGILTLGGSGGARCSLNRVLIQSVDMFGQRVGFVKFKAEVVDDETGAKLPGIVFARGGAVGILMLLECEGKKYAVLTEQARVPVGRTIMELPAGMLDDDAGDFVGTAAREVEEETGIHIKTSDLVDLTALLDESTGRKMFPSPGGSDEEITLLLYRGHVKQEVIDSLQGQETGLRDHGELIKVHVVPYETVWRATPDSKVLAAIALYEMALRLNLLPTPPNAPELSQL